ncbi:ABC transporter substrate-binding protein [Jannaschia sp. M317]|uniref:ABC transporter substrate-binding protein n=1 Tax=Jannaschia sp. M317 TaxID=2867011 RepID=UPI0021A7AFB3|nr:ABC transporter substrate-binding protein [Jannaschia sp. M317]UWQ16430.1 ABC transporter substrate-binding protein [Jannaschia sp. M317]
MTRLTRRALLQASAAALSLSFAMPALADGHATPGGTLRVSVNVTPQVLNPMLVRTNPEYMIAEMLYSGLTTLGLDMTAQPDLATEWSANADATQWTFTIREDAAFSNGEAVTPADVVASFEKLLDPETAAPGRRNLGPIASVAMGEGNSVVFTTDGPFADLPVALTYPTAKILPASVIESDFESLAQTPVGSGPFTMVEFNADQSAVFEGRDDYFVAGQPYLDGVEVLTFPDAAGSTAALLAGEVDLMLEVQPTDYERIAAADGIEGLRTPSGRFLDVVMDTQVEPWSDPRVRKALSMSVDREAMVELVAEGFGTPGNDSPVNSAYAYFSDGAPKTYDPEGAKALLAEAGYPDGLSLELVASEKPGYRSAMAVVLREMAKPAGFDISVKTMDHPTYLDQVWKQGPFYVGFYNMQPTEGTIFNLLFTSDASWNETKWNNTAFDALVSEADRTVDPAKRGALYGEAQALMRDEVPALVPVFFDLLGAKADHVENYEQHPRGANYALHAVSLSSDAPTR